ncbi:etoposide-induced protein 2.4 homolog [Centruroides vittatus]|uniref:etoposide-induced protein 2.4 homolog n=1 Tax=Centruroides vittatus TaxID=120091 RepID=UPI00350F4C1F
MDNLMRVFMGIVTGAKDSIWGILSIRDMNKEKETKPVNQLVTTTLSRRRKQESNRIPEIKSEETKISIRIFQCCLLNGGIFWASIALFSYLVLPGLHKLMNFVFSHSPSMAAFVWSWLRPILSCVFDALWVLPLFLLSRIINSLWFQDIANTAYRHVRGRPQYVGGFSKTWADNLFSFLIQVLFLMQSYLVRLLPVYILGQVAGIVHLCMLYSFYAFEYKWINMGWELHRRLAFIEMNWPYFIGFGLPLAVLTSLSSSFITSGIIFAIFFPLFIISGNEAVPMTGMCEYRLRLFSPVVYLSNAFFHRTINLDRQKLAARKLHS